MNTKDQIRDVLREWVAAANRGNIIPPEVLCKDSPELLTQVAQQVEIIMARAKRKREAHESRSDLLEVTAVSAPPPAERTEVQQVGLISLSAFSEYPAELGHYQLLRVLGEGGMGRVYLAEDTRLTRQVAIKLMRPDAAIDPENRQRFLHEARSIAALEHDHIIAIHQVGEEGQIPFLVMPLLKGEPLDRRLTREKRLPVPEAVRIAREIALGLACAHGKGLIHRDIKPANVWLEGDFGRVKILDFGLAKACRSEGVGLTQTGVVMGTPAYMAPEQARGHDVDFRSDLFSLGCVLYEMVTGRRPFTGSDTMAILTSLAVDRPVSPHALNPACPPGLSRLVDHLLEKDPDDRPASAQILADSLQRLVDGETLPPRAARHLPVAASAAPDRNLWADIDADDLETEVIPPSGARRATPVPARKSRLALIGGVVSLLLLASIGILVSAKGSSVAQSRAEEEAKVKSPVAARPGPVETPRVPPKRNTNALIDPEDPEFQAWRTYVSSLPAEKQAAAVIKKLQELNPGFDGVPKGMGGGEELPPRIQNRVVTELGFFTAHMHDLTPVRALKGLNSFWCLGSERLTNLSPLRDLPLNRLAVPCNRKLSDLSPLKGMPLSVLDVAHTEVSDLSPLRGMALTTLALQFTKVADLSPLKGMPLEQLNLLGTRNVSDLTPLKGMPMTHLWLREVSVEDLSPLEGMPLVIFDCSGTDAASLAPLKNAKLTSLSMFATRISDLSPLRGMPLQMIEAGGVPVEDLSPLEGMGLVRVEIPRTKVTNLHSLRGMPIDYLDIAETAVTDLSPLEGMPIHYLNLTGCKAIRDWTPLKKLPLESVHGDFDPDRDGALLRSITTLKKINDKPVHEFGHSGK